MFKPGRLRASPAASPLSPVSPRWLDEEDQAYFSSEPEEISEYSEKSLFVPTLVAQPRHRDRKWLGQLRNVTTELRAVFAGKSIGIPVDRMCLCLKPVDDIGSSYSEDACDEFALLSVQPAQVRLYWSEEGWFREASGLIHRLLVVLAQKEIGMDVNSFLDFVSINNSNKSSYETVLSGHLDKVRNRLLCKPGSPDMIPYNVFQGNVLLGTATK